MVLEEGRSASSVGELGEEEEERMDEGKMGEGEANMEEA